MRIQDLQKCTLFEQEVIVLLERILREVRSNPDEEPVCRLEHTTK